MNDLVKSNVDFQNHFVRHAILKVWNGHKTRWTPEVPL